MRHSVAARGILVKGDRVLMVEYETEDGLCYALPGGGQKVGEPLKETLKREFWEETSLEVKVGALALVREFILEESALKVWEGGIHQVEVVFFCELEGEQTAKMGSVLDAYMTGVKWIELSHLDQLIVYPKNLKNLLEQENVPYVLKDQVVKKEVDKHGILEQMPFSYRRTKEDKILISYQGKLIKTLKGKKSEGFLAKIVGKKDSEIQLVLAKETGNFKRGNEKVIEDS